VPLGITMLTTIEEKSLILAVPSERGLETLKPKLVRHVNGDFEDARVLSQVLSNLKSSDQLSMVLSIKRRKWSNLPSRCNAAKAVFRAGATY
jgi:hypothetical protein